MSRTKYYYPHRVSGTKNLYFMLFDKLPLQDISKRNEPILMEIIKQLPEKDHKRLVRYYGLGCPPTTLKALGKEEGFKSSEPILRSLEKSRRFLLLNYRRTIRLLFTPHFDAFRECTELGSCPWRGNCRVNIVDIANNPNQINKLDVNTQCETLINWRRTIPFALFESATL